MASVHSGEEILPKASTTWVGCTNVTDRRQTTDGIAIAKTRTSRSHIPVKTVEEFLSRQKFSTSRTDVVCESACELLHCCYVQTSYHKHYKYMTVWIWNTAWICMWQLICICCKILSQTVQTDKRLDLSTAWLRWCPLLSTDTWSLQLESWVVLRDVHMFIWLYLLVAETSPRLQSVQDKQMCV